MDCAAHVNLTAVVRRISQMHQPPDPGHVLFACRLIWLLTCVCLHASPMAHPAPTSSSQHLATATACGCQEGRHSPPPAGHNAYRQLCTVGDSRRLLRWGTTDYVTHHHIACMTPDHSMSAITQAPQLHAANTRPGVLIQAHKTRFSRHMWNHARSS